MSIASPTCSALPSHLPGALQVYEAHDGHETANVKAVGGWVEATIGADGPGTERVTQSIGMLEEEFAPGELVQGGWKFRHSHKIGPHGSWRAPVSVSTFTPR